MNLQLSIGITSNPRTWPIIDQNVKPDGIDLVPTVLHPSELEARVNVAADFLVTSETGPIGDTEIELTLETKGASHAEQLVSALKAKGYAVTRR